MKVMKINMHFFLIVNILIVCVSFLKLTYVDVLQYNSSFELIKNFIIFWGENNTVNLIWFLPIIFSTFYISLYCSRKMISFCPRYKNRKRFYKKEITECFIYSIINNLYILIEHIIFCELFLNNNFILTNEFFLFCSEYILEMTFLEFFVVIVSIIIKNYTLSYIVVISLCLILLNIVKNKNIIPFICLFFSNKFNFLTFFSFLFIEYIIKKMLISMDFGGETYDFGSKEL